MPKIPKNLISEINFRELDQHINSTYLKRKKDRRFKKAMAAYKNKNELVKSYKSIFGLNVLPRSKASI